MWKVWEPVREAARGSRFDYEFAVDPIDDTGGQAVVRGGKHKASGLEVAVKRLRIGEDTDDNTARMRREIEIGSSLRHPHVTPVLDHDGGHTWFVMPRAATSLHVTRDSVASDPDWMLSMIRQVAGGLQAAHDEEWVHRDIKPANILKFQDSNGDALWAVADWGMGRGPRGTTSKPDRTRVGMAYGTEGFAAPELSIDAHEATAAADIYSLGQLIGWLIVGTWPHPNIPLLPATGPWRHVVSMSTAPHPWRRPQSIPEFLGLVDEELNEPEELVASRVERLLEDLNAGATEKLRHVFKLAQAHMDDDELYLDVLPKLSRQQLSLAIRKDSEGAQAVLAAMGRHAESDWGGRQYKAADTVIALPANAARAANEVGDLAALEAALTAFCAWDERWDQWDPQKIVRGLLKVVQTEAAKVAARVLRRHPDSAKHFEDVLEDHSANREVREAIMGALHGHRGS